MRFILEIALWAAAVASVPIELDGHIEYYLAPRNYDLTSKLIDVSIEEGCKIPQLAVPGIALVDWKQAASSGCMQYSDLTPQLEESRIEALILLAGTPHPGYVTYDFIAPPDPYGPVVLYNKTNIPQTLVGVLHEQAYREAAGSTVHIKTEGNPWNIVNTQGMQIGFQILGLLYGLLTVCTVILAAYKIRDMGWKKIFLISLLLFAAFAAIRSFLFFMDPYNSRASLSSGISVSLWWMSMWFLYMVIVLVGWEWYGKLPRIWMRLFGRVLTIITCILLVIATSLILLHQLAPYTVISKINNFIYVTNIIWISLISLMLVSMILFALYDISHNARIQYDKNISRKIYLNFFLILGCTLSLLVVGLIISCAYVPFYPEVYFGLLLTMDSVILLISMGFTIIFFLFVKDMISPKSVHNLNGFQLVQMEIEKDSI